MNLSIFNPAHANGLTDEQIISMQSLSHEQVKELAKLFPNRGINTAYLVLKDKNKTDAEQLNPLSTWENLHNLHRAGLKHFTAVGFRDRFQSTISKAETAPLLDLTEEDIKEAQGLKRHEDNFVFPDEKVHPGFVDETDYMNSILPGEVNEDGIREIEVPKEFQEEATQDTIAPPAPIKRRGRPNKIQ